MSWCATFTRGPHLASRIVTLSLTMPAQTSLHADDVSRRKHALHFCVNLRNLSKHVGRGTPLLRLCGAGVSPTMLSLWSSVTTQIL